MGVLRRNLLHLFRVIFQLFILFKWNTWKQTRFYPLMLFWPLDQSRASCMKLKKANNTVFRYILNKERCIVEKTQVCMNTIQAKSKKGLYTVFHSIPFHFVYQAYAAKYKCKTVCRLTYIYYSMYLFPINTCLMINSPRLLYNSNYRRRSPSVSH